MNANTVDATQREELVDRVAKIAKQKGISIKTACKEAGITSSQFYFFKKDMPTARKTPRRKRKTKTVQRRSSRRVSNWAKATFTPTTTVEPNKPGKAVVLIVSVADLDQVLSRI